MSPDILALESALVLLMHGNPGREGEGEEVQGNEEESIQPGPGKPQTASPVSAAGILPHVCSRHPPPCLQQAPSLMSATGLACGADWQ